MKVKSAALRFEPAISKVGVTTNANEVSLATYGTISRDLVHCSFLAHRHNPVEDEVDRTIFTCVPQKDVTLST